MLSFGGLCKSAERCETGVYMLLVKKTIKGTADVLCPVGINLIEKPEKQNGQ